MLSRVQLLAMLVGLKQVGDVDLVDDDAVMRVSCSDADRETVRSIATIINRVYGHFDYANCPEFLEKLEGKSEQVQSMHRKLLTAEKRTDSIRRLGSAIASIVDSDEAFRLISGDHHYLLNELRSLVAVIHE